MAEQPPGAALVAWVKSIPAVHCVAGVVEPWTHASDGTSVRKTPTVRFDKAHIVVALNDLTTVASKGSLYWYGAAIASRQHAAVLHVGSEDAESDYIAVLADAPKPPRTLATLRETPRIGAIGLGSTRAAVERAFGTAKSTAACGFDVVRYEPQPAVISEAALWFIYRDGVVVGFSRLEAV